MIRFLCRKCRTRYEVPDDMGGWLVPCRVCRTENVAKWPNLTAEDVVPRRRRRKRRRLPPKVLVEQTAKKYKAAMVYCWLGQVFASIFVLYSFILWSRLLFIVGLVLLLVCSVALGAVKQAIWWDHG
jgi:hypothetical protein